MNFSKRLQRHARNLTCFNNFYSWTRITYAKEFTRHYPTVAKAQGYKWLGE